MIIEITSNPHSFIVFLTASMGIGYAFFKRRGFGLGKLITLLFLGGPMLLTAYERGHTVDIGLGLIIGFLHAKGVIQAINPFTWINSAFDKLRWKLQAQRNEREQASSQAESNREYDDFREQETRKRQEQAKQEREQTKRKNAGGNQNRQKQSSNQSQQKSSSSNHRYEQYNKSYEKPKRLSERDKALAVLGLGPNATMAEAKRARSKLMSLYHPDKLAGLPEGRRNQAEDEAKKINVAWKILKKGQ